MRVASHGQREATLWIAFFSPLQTQQPLITFTIKKRIYCFKGHFWPPRAPWWIHYSFNLTLAMGIHVSRVYKSLHKKFWRKEKLKQTEMEIFSTEVCRCPESCQGILHRPLRSASQDEWRLYSLPEGAQLWGLSFQSAQVRALCSEHTRGKRSGKSKQPPN